MTLPIGTLSIGDISNEVTGNPTRRTALTDVLAVTRPPEYPTANIPLQWYDQDSPAPPAQGGTGWAYYNNDIRNSNCNNANVGMDNGNCSNCGNAGTQNCHTDPLVNGVDFTPHPRH